MARKKKIRTRKDLSYKAKGVKRAKKKAATRKSTAPKTRNNGTMTESNFWSFIRSALRNRSRFWKPILAVKNDAKVPYIGDNKRRRFSYVCGNCSKEVDAKSCAVHHIVECGSLTCANDLPGFVERLFCEKESLILLCNDCHNNLHRK